MSSYILPIYLISKPISKLVEGDEAPNTINFNLSGSGYSNLSFFNAGIKRWYPLLISSVALTAPNNKTLSSLLTPITSLQKIYLMA